MKIDLVLLCVSAIVGMVSTSAEKDSTLLNELNELFSNDDKLQQDEYLSNINKVESYFKQKNDELEKNLKKRENEAGMKSDLNKLENMVTQKKDTTKDSKTDMKSDLHELLNLVNRKKDVKDSTIESIIDDMLSTVEVQKREDNNVGDEDKCIDAKGLNYCYRKALAGECHENAAAMERDCKRSCRFCCADDQTMVGTASCEKFKDHNQCHTNKNQDRLRVFCPKTCEFCGKAPAEPPCVRSTHGCCWDGTTAKSHVGTADDGCPACKDRYKTEFCQKFEVDCNNTWNLAGQQIRLLCPMTCGMCGAHKVCRDDPRVGDSCIQYAKEGACVTNFHTMRFSCAKSCNICHKTTIDCKYTTYGCCADGNQISKGWYKQGCKECLDAKDKRYDCQYLKKHNACKTHRERMEKKCAGTCGYCTGA